MSWRSLYQSASSAFEQAGLDQPQRLARHWLADSFGVSPSSKELPSREALRLVELQFERLLAGEPLAYVTGLSHFYGLRISVSPEVLIPRAETEELVRWILERENEEKVHFLDACTGSACIGVALAHERIHWTGVGVDISSKALQIAQHNIEAYNLGSRLSLELQDVLVPWPEPVRRSLDFVVSNPPYIPDADWHRVGLEVAHWEPHLALRVSDEKPLVFYEQIAKAAKLALRTGGRLYFECNDLYTMQVAELLGRNGYSSVETLTDMQGKLRHACGVLAK